MLGTDKPDVSKPDLVYFNCLVLDLHPAGRADIGIAYLSFNLRFMNEFLISSWNDGESRQSRENAKQKYLAAACKLQVLVSKRDKMPASIKMIFDRTARASGP